MSDTIESKIVKQGWVVITPTVFKGDVIAWSTEDEDTGAAVPWIFPTENDAWKEIAEGLITELQQFIDGEREYDDVSWDGSGDYVANYEQYEDGTIVVTDPEGIPVIETTLEKWRKNR